MRKKRGLGALCWRTDILRKCWRNVSSVFLLPETFPVHGRSITRDFPRQERVNANSSLEKNSAVTPTLPFSPASQERRNPEPSLEDARNFG
jgi:hypothetical protein